MGGDIHVSAFFSSVVKSTWPCLLLGSVSNVSKFCGSVRSTEVGGKMHLSY